MAKNLFKTSDDVYEFIDKEWQNTEMALIGVTLKVVSTKKAKQIIKISKANPTTEYLLREDSVLTMVVYEEAWDRLSDLNRTLLLKGALSVYSYDTEKDRLDVDTRPYADLFIMRHAKDANGEQFGDKYDNTLETASLVIQQIEDERREEKEAEKERKAAARAAKKAAKEA